MTATVNHFEAFLGFSFTTLGRSWMRVDRAKWIMLSVATSVVRMCAGNVSKANLIVHMPVLPDHDKS